MHQTRRKLIRTLSAPTSILFCGCIFNGANQNSGKSYPSTLCSVSGTTDINEDQKITIKIMTDDVLKEQEYQINPTTGTDDFGFAKPLPIPSEAQSSYILVVVNQEETRFDLPKSNSQKMNIFITVSKASGKIVTDFYYRSVKNCNN